MAMRTRAAWSILTIALIGILCGAAFGDAPAPPSSMEVLDHPGDDGTAMDVFWGKSPDDGGGQDNVTQYHVFRMKLGGVCELATKVDATGSDDYEYTDTGLEPMTRYWFAVRAAGPDGSSDAVSFWCRTVNNEVPTPGIPENFNASDAPGPDPGCLLEWDASADDGAGADNVLRYFVFRRPFPGGGFVYVKHIEADGSAHYSDIDRSCTQDVQYQYALRAFDGNSQSDAVYDQAISHESPPPAAPGYICVDDHPGDDGTAMDLCWPKSRDDGANLDNVTQYHIFRMKEGGVTELDTRVDADGSASYSYTSTGLEPVTRYWFAVRAAGPDGASDTVHRWGRTVNNEVPAPGMPQNFVASDAPGDNGSGCLLEWEASADDGAGADNVLRYFIFRRPYPAGAFIYVTHVEADGSAEYSHIDRQGVLNGVPYEYALRAYDGNQQSQAAFDRAVSEDNRAPGPPRNFEARWNPQGNGRSILLTWDKSVDDHGGLNDVRQYRLWRRPLAGGDLQLVKRYNADGRPSFEVLDTGLKVNTGYEYFLEAWDGSKSSQPAYDTAQTKDTLPPAPPSGFTVTDRPDDNGDALILKWDKSPDDGDGLGDVREYKLWRSRGAPTNYINFAAIKADGSGTYEYTDSGLKANTTYYYLIAAHDGFNPSPRISASGTTVDDNPCRPPSNLKLVNLGGAITVSWDASPDDGSGLDNVVEYVVWRRTVPGDWSTLPRVKATDADSYEFTDTGVVVGKTYEYGVAATNGHTVSASIIARKVAAAPVAAPGGIDAKDHPYDHGGVIDITFERSPDDGTGRDHVVKYEIFRKVANVNYELKKVHDVTATDKASYTVADSVPDNFILYEYRVRAVSNQGVASDFAGPALQTAQDNLVLSFQPPSNLTAEDRPNDSGGQILLSWQASPSEGDPGTPPPPPLSVDNVDTQATYRGVYEFYRRTQGGSYTREPTFKVSADGSTNMTYVDSGLDNGVTYVYKVRYRRYNQISKFTKEASASPAVGTAGTAAAGADDHQGTADANEPEEGLSVSLTDAPEEVKAGTDATVGVTVRSTEKVAVYLEWAVDGGNVVTGNAVSGQGEFSVQLILPTGSLARGSEVHVRAIADAGDETAKSDTHLMEIQ